MVVSNQLIARNKENNRYLKHLIPATRNETIMIIAILTLADFPVAQNSILFFKNEGDRNDDRTIM